jgi:hypothetical protein
MSGSGASNYGYGNITPNSNVNPTYVNVDGSNYPGGFGTDVIPKSIHSLQAPPDNIVAASGTWTGNGGRKNIHKVYKSMKAGRRKSTRSKTLKKSSKHRKGKSHKKHMKGRKSYKRRGGMIKHSHRSYGMAKTDGRMHHGGRKRKSRKGKSKRTFKLRRKHRMKGGMGYSQFQSNVPYTPGYAVAGVDVAPSMSATANPPPYESYNHCKDNYNHYAATQGK